jgi:cytoskeletal protein CcmA (bactofilin family)
MRRFDLPTRTSELEASLQPVWRLPATMQVVGELRSDMDLSLDGRVSGKVCAEKSVVTIGACARISADVAARTVLVRGCVIGDIRAAEKVTLARSATVSGNIWAPRVCLEEGSTFNGRIDDHVPAAGRLILFPKAAER